MRRQQQQQPQPKSRPTSAVSIPAQASANRSGLPPRSPTSSPSSSRSSASGASPPNRDNNPILVRGSDSASQSRSRSNSPATSDELVQDRAAATGSRRQGHRRRADAGRDWDRDHRRDRDRGRERDRDQRGRDSRKRRHDNQSPSDASAAATAAAAKLSRRAQPSSVGSSSTQRQEEDLRRRLQKRLKEKQQQQQQQQPTSIAAAAYSADSNANEDEKDLGTSPMVSIEDPAPVAMASSPSSSSSSGSDSPDRSSASSSSSSGSESPVKSSKKSHQQQQQPPPQPSQEQQQQQQTDEISRPPRRVYLPAIQGCRNVEEFHCLNRIEEGTYGVVYRAYDKKTKEIVALKRLKMENEREGFPITSLREINTLLKAQHENIVTVREIVVGSNMDKIFIVMDYVEHDLKALMEIMTKPFKIEEVKCLMVQLLRAVAHLHDNWILHRDLKTSNLLLSHKGILKVGDFGLAREYGSPLRKYTSIVVTLWYRSVELLMGTKLYSTPIDCWSVGCIFGELLLKEPLFRGKGELEQLKLVFRDLGRPSEKIWPGVLQLPMGKRLLVDQPMFDGEEYRFNRLKNRFPPDRMSDAAFSLINGLLTFDPAKRLSAEQALKHEYFSERPAPIDPALFPTWPARSEGQRAASAAAGGHHHQRHSPKPPSGGKAYSRLIRGGDGDIFNSSQDLPAAAAPSAAVAAAAAAAAAVTAKLPPPGQQSGGQAPPPGFNLRGF